MSEFPAFASLVGLSGQEMCDERVPCTIVIVPLRSITLKERVDLVANASGHVRPCFFKHSTGPEWHVLYPVGEGRDIMRGGTYRLTPSTEYVK